MGYINTSIKKALIAIGETQGLIKAYNASQPRWPEGSKRGGQWKSKGGGGGKPKGSGGGGGFNQTVDPPNLRELPQPRDYGLKLGSPFVNGITNKAAQGKLGELKAFVDNPALAMPAAQKKYGQAVISHLESKATPASKPASAKSKPASDNRSKAVLSAANKHFGLDSLETQKSGRDFHDVAVWNIKAGLTDAYNANPKNKPKNRDKKINQVAKDVFFLDTLETQKSDALDFHEVAVWQVKSGLEAAYGED